MQTNFIKDFDGWIDKKKFCHYQNAKPPLFKERDIWWLSVGINVGFEEDGKNGNYVRPVLIAKKFNNEYYVPVTVKRATVSVITSQLRSFSSKRIWNKLAELDEGDFYRVIEEVGKFFILPFPQERGGRG